MQTVITKYLPATNTKGSRIKATTSGSVKTFTRSYNHNISAFDNHKNAAAALMHQLGWDYADAIGGDTKDGTVWVFIDRDRHNVIPATRS